MKISRNVDDLFGSIGTSTSLQFEFYLLRLHFSRLNHLFSYSMLCPWCNYFALHQVQHTWNILWQGDDHETINEIRAQPKIKKIANCIMQNARVAWAHCNMLLLLIFFPCILFMNEWNGIHSACFYAPYSVCMCILLSFIFSVVIKCGWVYEDNEIYYTRRLHCYTESHRKKAKKEKRITDTHTQTHI